MERDTNICGVIITYFNGGNGILKSAEFRLELKDNHQIITYFEDRSHHKIMI